MHPQDRQEYIQRYEQYLEKYGYSPESLGWGKHGRQDVRFSVLAKDALERPDSSILDVGCGFADLFDFLGQHGWRGQYTGVDIVPGLLEVARDRHPTLRLLELDIVEPTTLTLLQPHDFVVASGIFNAKLTSGDNSNSIINTLNVMFKLAKVCVAVDFLSQYVDFQKPESWHTKPSWAFETGLSLSKRVLLRHDYMPYEFALFIFKDSTISPQNVFQAIEEQINV